MKKTLTISIVMAVMVVGVVAIANADDELARAHRASTQIAGTTAVDHAAPTSKELGIIRALVGGVPSDSADYTGPTTEDLPSLDDAKVVFDESDQGRVVAIAMKSGEVCFTASLEGRHLGATCVPDLNDEGMSYVTARDGDLDAVFGLVASDVTAVEVHDKAGKVADAVVENHVYLWHDHSGEDVTKVVGLRADGTVRGTYDIKYSG